MTRYGNLQDVVQCSWYWPRIDAAEHSMLQKYNKTACNFEDPLTGAFIRCAGGESIRFTTCGPGVDEVVSPVALPLLLVCISRDFPPHSG